MLGIYAFGHGGGVPGPIPGTPVQPSGNTNFAIIPNLTFDARQWMAVPHPSLRLYGENVNAHSDGNPVRDLLAQHDYYLVDCGPETALTLCGAIGHLGPVAKNCKGIFLTHAHDDHSGGIKSLGYRFKFIEGTRPFLAVPDDDMFGIILSQTREMGYLNAMATGERTLEAFYALRLESGWDGAVRDEDDKFLFRMDAFTVDHNCYNAQGERFPAVGYYLSFADGQVVAFTGDTARPSGLGTLPSDRMKAVIHDVQFYASHDPAAHKQSYVHCPYGLIRDAVSPDLRHKVLLTHTAHDLPPEAVADGFSLLKGGTLIVLED